MRKIPYILILAIILPSFLMVTQYFFAPTIAQAQTGISEEGRARIAAENARVLELARASREAAARENEAKPFGLTCISFTSFDFGSCVALLGYYLFWYPTNLLLILAAAIFDTMAAWSFNADILRSPMVSAAWGMIRDLANLSLIFALLYIAIATILQIGGVQLKKAVANVIIVALLINFSLFVTQIVIDTSNILASSLYSRITANAPSTTAIGPSGVGTVEVKQISARIVATFDPQKFLTQDFVDAWKTSRDGLSGVFFVFLFAAFVNLVAIYAFLRAGLLLIGRVVMFVFLLISSPLAFAAWALPGGGDNFDKKWWGALIDQALVAPVFFLFLYVITTVYSSSLIDGIIRSSAGLTLLPFLINIALHFVIIIVALLIAVKVTSKLAGAAGAYATKIGGGIVGGAVFGGAAMAGRVVVGGAATRMAESGRFKEFAANNPTIGRIVKGGLDRTASANFDARSIIGSGELGKPAKGGYTADLKSRIEAKEKLGKHLGDLSMGTREVTKFREKEEWRPHPSGALDSSGNPIMEKIKVRKEYKENVPVTAKQVYTEKLGKTIYGGEPDPEDTAWARSSRNAAKNLRKSKTPKDEMFELLKKEYESEQKTKEPIVTPETTEKPKEA